MIFDMTESNQELDAELISQMSAFIQSEFLKLRTFILDNAGKAEFTSKADGSPQTTTDLEVERRLLEAYRAHYTDIPIFGEESGYGENMPPTFWLIDPIDGTQSYIDNQPAFTCMAVLIDNEQPVASIIYNPTTNDMYTAIKGQGAYKNRSLLKLNESPIPDLALAKGRYIPTLDPLLNEVNIKCEIGLIGAGFGFVLVAEGLRAARFMLGSRGYPHDYATGLLLVEEAGGKIILVNDTIVNYKTKSFVACHPQIAQAIEENIEAIRALEA